MNAESEAGSGGMRGSPAPETAQALRRRLPAPGWICGALLIFVCAIALTFRSVVEEGVAAAVPIGSTDRPREEIHPVARLLQAADIRLGTSLVAHNARAWTRAPQRIFDTPHCAPAHHTLATSDPLIALGLLGVPADLAGSGPIATYNFAVASHLLFSALSMALLVFDWTRVPAAALVAGLLYAFDLPRLRDIEHTFVRDTSWILLAMVFARRLLAFGRWRDAAGLAASTSLQLGTSLYALLAAASVAGPVLAWCLWHYRLRQARALQLAFATSIVLLAAWFVFGPYLELRAAGDIQPRAQVFTGWADFAPGGTQAVTWSVLGLALLGLAFPARYGLAPLRGDPRLALLLGACIAVAVSTGPIFSSLSALLPGLDVVRVPARVSNGVNLAGSVLAGIGAASLVRVARRGVAATAVQAALLLLVGLESLALPNLAAHSGFRFDALIVRPPDESLEFLEKLEQLGNSGPMLELPLERNDPEFMELAPERVLLSAYHHRRTSACIGSFIPQERLRLLEIVGRFDADFDALIELGFTTLILHHPSPDRAPQRAWLENVMRKGGPIHILLEGTLHTAYAIDPAPKRTRERTAPAQAR